MKTVLPNPATGATGENMAEDIGKIIGAIFGLFIFCIFGIAIVNILFGTLSEQQCQPYKDTISQKETIIGGLNSTLQETANQLAQCNANYNQLVNYNITKQDFTEIKGYYNITQIAINNINQKFDQISENYISIYKTVINRYNISLSLNIVFGIEILSFAFLKSELIMYALTWIRKKRGKEKEDAD